MGIITILHDLSAWFDEGDDSGLIELTITERGGARLAKELAPLMRYPSDQSDLAVTQEIWMGKSLIIRLRPRQ